MSRAMSARMSELSIVAQARAAEPGSMQDLLICAAVLVLLVVVDLAAMNWGYDLRGTDASLWNTDSRQYPWVWW